MEQKRGKFHMKVSLVCISDITESNIVSEMLLEVQNVLQATRPNVTSEKDSECI